MAGLVTAWGRKLAVGSFSTGLHRQWRIWRPNREDLATVHRRIRKPAGKPKGVDLCAAHIYRNCTAGPSDIRQPALKTDHQPIAEVAGSAGNVRGDGQ